jgi:acetyl coenzyme A synthetase (ADP forming)-like protein
MNLNPLFSPRSIAVVGASTKVGSVGSSLTKNLLSYGYTGHIYPVNPKTDRLFDLPCYPSLSDIKEEIDLAIIIIPAALIPAILREVGEKEIPAAVIISSGFKETGADGTALEDEVREVAEEYNIALLGPNCLGFLHPALGLNASFASGMPKVGGITFFSQSGALCTALLDLSAGRLGFSAFVSNGNKAILSEKEFLEYFAQDEETKVLSFYTEGMRDSEHIIETGRAILARSEPKPVIALKSGTTDAGTAASSSHTGALAGSNAAYEALFRQARIIRADSLQSLANLLMVFSRNPLPEGKRIGIITNAGGLGVLATDMASQCGLTLATLSGETVTALDPLPPSASRHNPVDVLGDAPADRYRLALEALARDPEVDMLLVIITPQTTTEVRDTALAIVDTKHHTEKPIVAIMAGASAFAEGIAILDEHEVAVLTYPEDGARALGALAQVANWRTHQLSTPFAWSDIDRTSAQKIIKQVRADGRTTLYESEVWDVLSAYGFQFLRSATVHSADEAKAASQDFTGPVALKIVSPDISHKSDAGGVMLNVKPEEAGEQYDALLARVAEHVPEAKLEGALMVEMAETGGREIILGMKEEPGLGQLLMVGLGGIYVETFHDVAFRFAPLTEEDAREMVSELASLPLLTGTRGQAGIDMDTLLGAIGRLSLLVRDFPEIAELDINPLLAFPEASRFRVLDARIRLKEI